MPPDTPELDRLRWFRDTVLAADASGRDRIDAYYRLAPVLIDLIGRQSAQAFYAGIYRDHIAPGLAAIDRGDMISAAATFERLLCRMSDLIAVLDDGDGHARQEDGLCRLLHSYKPEQPSPAPAGGEGFRKL